MRYGQRGISSSAPCKYSPALLALPELSWLGMLLQPRMVLGSRGPETLHQQGSTLQAHGHMIER